MIPSSTTGAYVYHDGYTIKGLSFIIDNNLEEKYNKLIIPNEKAIEFIHGDLNHNNWFFWNNCLYPKNSGITKDGAFNIDTDYYILKNTDGLIDIKIYKKTQKIVITTKEKISKAINPIEKLTFFLTEKNDPSIIYYIFDVLTEELFTSDIVLPLRIEKEFDVYTKRIWAEYSVEYIEE